MCWNQIFEWLNATHAFVGTGSLIHGTDSNYFETFLKWLFCVEGGV